MTRHVLPALAIVALLPASAAARATDGTVSTRAGTVSGFAGDGGPAIQAQLAAPNDVALAPDGTLFVADTNNDRIRRVAPNGIITTVSGDGSGDPGCADGATALSRPAGVAINGTSLLVADTEANCIQAQTSTGLKRIAGDREGDGGFAGDGGPARAALLDAPSALATAPDGSTLIADTGNNRIRRVAPDGTITTIAGGATQGFGGDGGPATAAALDQPRDVAVYPDGRILIADSGNDRIREIAAGGTITTVAGGATAGLAGDGDPATGAQLNLPLSVATLDNGGFLVADTGNQRVRRVTPLGAIFTVAGTTGGLAGDGGAAKAGRFSAPHGLARAGDSFVVADTGNSRVRSVSALGAVPGAVVGHSINVEPARGAVTVQPAGTTAFLPLDEEDIVPVGSSVDARTGKLTVTVARNGVLDPATVFEGSFTVTQGTEADPATDLTMTGDLGCTAARTASIARRKKGGKRRLWVDAHGKYQIKGRYVGALERGTFWRVTDRCHSSTVRVIRGAVTATNLATGRTRIVRAGTSFTVRG